MATLHCTTEIGKIKPMHAVNNGPGGSAVRGTGNDEAFCAAGIPYARNHDASFYSGYGGEDTVDVHRIFRDFSRNEYDPASYDFRATDAYVARTEACGTHVFYRLGASIEHGIKHGTFPPPTLPNGRGSAPTSSATTMRGGPTASITASPIGRYGTSRTA